MEGTSMSEALLRWPEDEGNERAAAVLRIQDRFWQMRQLTQNTSETLDFWAAEDKLDGMRELREMRKVYRDLSRAVASLGDAIDEYDHG